MKKCPNCEREIDKMTIVCEFCGRLEQEHRDKSQKTNLGNQKSDKTSKSTKGPG